MLLGTFFSDLLYNSKIKEFNKEIQNLKKSSSKYTKCILNNLKFSNISLEHINFSNFIFYNCEFINVDLQNSNFSFSEINYCDFSKSDLSDSNFGNSSLLYNEMVDTILYNTNAINSYFYKNNLTKACFKDSILIYSVFKYSNLNKANFQNTILNNINIFKCTVTDTIFPPYQICPEEGSFIGYKRLYSNNGDHLLCKLCIPFDAKRNTKIGFRSCKTDCVKVLEIRDIQTNQIVDTGYSNCQKNIKYTTGDIIYDNFYDDSITSVWSQNGIYFYTTKMDVEKNELFQIEKEILINEKESDN